MNFKINELYSGFRLIAEEAIKEVNGIGRIFKHEQSGATLVSITNDDRQKVFTVSFKTPPQNDYGIPHIVEHSVCCASEKYPLKETFVAMEKGSVCSALNACTYPDVTMYYAASPNEKDLLGLMEVYMDLTFHPLIYKEPNLFMQEGWRYEVDETDGKLSYGGVVYHEMEGEYAEAMTRLEYTTCKTLFPDTPYQYDAGGVPSEIVKLSRETFLDFHKKHYQGSNCLIYLYGDGDLLAQLKHLDEVTLSKLENVPTDITIPLQQPTKAPKYVSASYPVMEDELEAQHLMSMSFVIGEATDVELRLGFELLEHILLRSSASPLLEALVVKKELGIGIGEGGYDTGKRQPVFSIVLKGTDESKQKEFEQTVFSVLEELAYKGIDPALIDAALHTLEFELREVDASYEPVGIQYSEMVLSSYLYGGWPFAHLKHTEIVNKIKALKDKGYFEELIKRYLLNNTHYVLVTMAPSKEQMLEELNKQEERLESYRIGLSKEVQEVLISQNKALYAMQEQPNTLEDLALLPTLTRGDMKVDVEDIKVKTKKISGVEVQYHIEETKDIVYLHTLFDTNFLSPDEVPYMGLLAHLMTYLGTTKLSYGEVENQINSLTGGINCALHAYTRLNALDSYRPMLKITSKVLVEQLEDFNKLLIHLLTETSFNEKAKIKEIIGNIQYELDRSFQGAPEYRATRRTYAYFSPAGAYEDHVSGIHFYHFVKALYEDFDAQYEALVAKLEEVYYKVIKRNHLIISVTAKAQMEEQLTKVLGNLIEALPVGKDEAQRAKYDFELTHHTEAYCVAQKVNAVAKGFNFEKAGYAYHGALEVLVGIIESSYLWDNVRLKGGAYGCDLILDRDGNLVVCSYCDPHLKETLDIYEGMSEFVANLTLDTKELERYIISTIGAMQMPLSTAQKSERAVNYYLCGMNVQLLKQAIEEVLNVTLEDLRSFSGLFKAFNAEEYYCVVGNNKQIKKHKKLFASIID